MNSELPVPEDVPPVRPVQLRKVILPLFLASIVTLVLLGLAGYRTQKSQTTADKMSVAFTIAVKTAKQADDTAGTTSNPGTAVVAAGNQAALAASDDMQRAVADYWLARGYFWEGNNALALDCADKSLGLGGGSNVDTLILAGQLSVNLHQFDPAVGLANRALSFVPDDPRGYRVRAFAEYDQGASGAAAQDIHHVADLDVAQGQTALVQTDANDQAAMQSSGVNFISFQP